MVVETDVVGFGVSAVRGSVNTINTAEMSIKIRAYFRLPGNPAKNKIAEITKANAAM